VDPTSRLKKKGPTELWDPTWVPHFRGPSSVGPFRDVGPTLAGSHFLGAPHLLGPTLIGSHLGSYGEGPAVRWMSCGSRHQLTCCMWVLLGSHNPSR
jgi:hypothetical protein